MKQFNVQMAGEDFVPLLPWSTDLSASAAALQAPESRDLLVVDDATDQMTIVPQVELENLLDRLGHSVYGRLASQVLTVKALTPSVASYLLVDLAQLEHATLLATLGALVGMLVVEAKMKQPTVAALVGVAGQAQCWLQQTRMTVHQLLLPRGQQVLRQLTTQLLTQSQQYDCYVPVACDTHAGQLAQESWALASGDFRALQLPAAWRLLRVAGQERRTDFLNH